jgi:hypothetical protein
MFFLFERKITKKKENSRKNVAFNPIDFYMLAQILSSNPYGIYRFLENTSVKCWFFSFYFGSGCFFYQYLKRKQPIYIDEPH